jgi:hypothetical protein
MARHGDGLYLRGQTWYLDCRNRMTGGLTDDCRYLCEKIDRADGIVVFAHLYAYDSGTGGAGTTRRDRVIT